MRQNTLLLIYNSFGDPLFQNLVLSYVKTLSKSVDAEFHLLTFEQPRYKIDEEEMPLIRKELQDSNIYWHPLTFHTGRFLLLKKAWDLGSAITKVISLYFRKRLRVVFCFANVSAAMGVIIKRILGLRMIIYSYEPHSEFQVELDLWSRSSMKYRVLNVLENYAGTQADYIMTGTIHMVHQLQQKGTRAEVFRAPTAVDAEAFQFSEADRSRVRMSLGIADGEFVIIYVGKFGDLYYAEEIPMLFQSIASAISHVRFVCVTSNDHDMVEEMFKRHLDPKQFHVTGNLSYEELKAYLSASDMGVSGVPPSPSQKFRSPTKVAEYLLMGLPYITTRGVSEDDSVAVQENVGMVVDSFYEQCLKDENVRWLRSLMTEDRSLLRQRCREVGLTYRSKERIDQILSEIYRQL